jgi:hypothetical protein
MPDPPGVAGRGNLKARAGPGKRGIEMRTRVVVSSGTEDLGDVPADEVGTRTLMPRRVPRIHESISDGPHRHSSRPLAAPRQWLRVARRARVRCLRLRERVTTMSAPAEPGHVGSNATGSPRLRIARSTGPGEQGSVDLCKMFPTCQTDLHGMCRRRMNHGVTGIGCARPTPRPHPPSLGSSVPYANWCTRPGVGGRLIARRAEGTISRRPRPVSSARGPRSCPPSPAGRRCPRARHGPRLRPYRPGPL